MDFKSSKYSAESIYLGFDFSNRLGVGETISTATFSNACVESVDVNSSAMLTGTSVISNGVVSHMVASGIAGNKYVLTCIITTSGSRVLEARAVFKVI